MKSNYQRRIHSSEKSNNGHEESAHTSPPEADLQTAATATKGQNSDWKEHTSTQEKLVDALKKVQIAEAEFSLAFEYAAIGMGVIDLGLKWTRVNKSLCELTGYSKSELIGMHYSELVHPKDVEKDSQQMQQLLNSQNENFMIEQRYVTKSGKVIWVSISVGKVLEEDGKFRQLVKQVQDVTERKKTELALKKSEKEAQELAKHYQNLLEVTGKQNLKLKSFAYIISHNIRSHSANFIGLLGLLNQTEEPAERGILLSMLGKSADQLEETIRNLNEVIAVNEVHQQNNEKKLLANAIQKTLAMLQTELLSSGSLVHVQVPSMLSVSVIPAYLESILLNLLSNAIKYRSPDRPLEIRIEAAVEGSFAVLSIADNGLGMDLEANGNKLFGMYQRFHGNNDARGFGLYLVKNQTEAMGGKVLATSKLGEGSVFFVYLPI